MFWGSPSVEIVILTTIEVREVWIFTWMASLRRSLACFAWENSREVSRSSGFLARIRQPSWHGGSETTTASFEAENAFSAAMLTRKQQLGRNKLALSCRSRAIVFIWERSRRQPLTYLRLINNTLMIKETTTFLRSPTSTYVCPPRITLSSTWASVSACSYRCVCVSPCMHTI